jgi:hypothetical protein
MVSKTMAVHIQTSADAVAKPHVAHRAFSVNTAFASLSQDSSLTVSLQVYMPYGAIKAADR